MPPIEYFVLLSCSDHSIIEQFETYQKQTYRNRCLIYTEKGKMPLTVPVSKPFGNHTKTKDILIFNREKWFIKHWRAIETAYQSAPFFLYYSDEVRMFYEGTFNRLIDFNLGLTRLFCHLTGVSTPISLSDDYADPSDVKQDYRTAFSSKKPHILKDFHEYTQVFSAKHGFIPNLSIIDLVFNLGPDSSAYISELQDQLHKKC